MKFLHTSITVRRMDESLAFYTEVLGLEFERRRTIPENHAEIAFVRDPVSGARVELTHWDGKDDRSRRASSSTTWPSRSRTSTYVPREGAGPGSPGGEGAVPPLRRIRAASPSCSTRTMCGSS